ncbi:MAG: SPOR domain-containing protein, partial [Desulfatitalea sp.]
ANELLAQLNARGYAAYTVRTDVDGAVWFRVRIGYFPTKKEADPVIDKLRADQYTPILIKL